MSALAETGRGLKDEVERRGENAVVSCCLLRGQYKAKAVVESRPETLIAARVLVQFVHSVLWSISHEHA